MIHPVSTTESTATFSAIVHQPNISSNCLFTPEGPCMAGSFLAFSEVNCLDVATFLRNVNPHLATGPDGIPRLMLSKFSNILTSSTSYLVNESLSCATVPQAFKQAAACPIFKIGELNVFSNYRPVSLLPSPSTILERVVLCQLQNFISQSDPPILPPEQFAYRHSPSCEDLLS